MNTDQKNHNHQIESGTRQENKDNVEVWGPRMIVQQSSDTVQQGITTGYVTGYLNQ